MSFGLASKFEVLWNSSEDHPDVFEFLEQLNTDPGKELLPLILKDQQLRWEYGKQIPVEVYLQQLPAIQDDQTAMLRLIFGETKAAQTFANTAPDINDLTKRFPSLRDQILAEFQDLESVGETPDLATETLTLDLTSNEAAVRKIGRYQILNVIGEGAFGRVYLGFDTELHRQVAIKVPKEELFTTPEVLERYQEEARLVAQLDHPHIVPVYDVGRSEEGLVYVVSKLVEGNGLDEIFKEATTPIEQIVQWIASIADALAFAHQRRLIHRDVKPANILIENDTGSAFLTDFGLAIREDEYLVSRGIAGTPAYMSPEQSRGEGHRIDGRSDVFSLGVVLYEALTGKRPFRGGTPNEVIQEITSVNPRAPRLIDKAISEELDRICLKALSKQRSERHSTAADFAEDLRNWKAYSAEKTDKKSELVVPRGLRSYGKEDNSFFMDLLPGPKAAGGIPESIHYWKTRIEDANVADPGFAVGLLFGPSGSGKSSFLKAGLLPRLSPQINVVYVEATANETESRLLRLIGRTLPQELGQIELREGFRRLRTGQYGKHIVVVDQFEQWLNANYEFGATELVAAFRHCDGNWLQAIVSVRDDFGMPMARFFAELDIPIVQGKNFATIDLFNKTHARNVLTQFGIAYEKTVTQNGESNAAVNEFIEQSIDGLADDGKVIPVRMSLFAEMVKGREWNPKTLDEIGGAKGVGVNFLEETFTSSSANPRHKSHSKAARLVLSALLPKVGSDIKGNMLSHKELQDISEYNQDSDFTDLLKTLDGELRLITPTDPEGTRSHSDEDYRRGFYQLTHDYLVPAIREWIERKQNETSRGRAQLLLEERANYWGAQQNSRQMPSFLEWIRIRSLTDKKKWQPIERQLMAASGRRYGLWTLLFLFVLIFGPLTAYEVNGRFRAGFLVDQIPGAGDSQILGIADDCEPWQRWVVPRLESNIEKSWSDNQTAIRKARVVLHELGDESQVAKLSGMLLQADFSEFQLLRQTLTGHHQVVTPTYWGIFQNEDEPMDRRLRAGLALVNFEPASENWREKDFDFLARSYSPLRLSEKQVAIEEMEPVASRLLSKGDAAFRSRLAEVVAAKDIIQFKNHVAKWFENYQLSAASSLNEQTEIGRSIANMAINLVRMNEFEAGLDLLRVSSNPEPITQFVHGHRANGVSNDQLFRCFMLALKKRRAVQGTINRPQENVLFAMILALGEHELTSFSDQKSLALIDELVKLFKDDPSSGIHGASRWLLYHWNRGNEIQDLERQNIPYDQAREWFVKEIVVDDGENLYLPFVVFEADTYTIGTEFIEFAWHDKPTKREVEITYRFAILQREVLASDYLAVDSTFIDRSFPRLVEDEPAPRISWFGAVDACRELSQLAKFGEQAYEDPEILLANGNEAHPDCPDDKKRPIEWPIHLEKHAFRLPTEAEWEIACRAGTRTQFSFGNEIEMFDKYGFLKDNTDVTKPISYKHRPNLRGLFDMHGNDAEWVHDGHPDVDRESQDTILTDPVGNQKSTDRRFRGAGWIRDESESHSSYAMSEDQERTRFHWLGFRIAITIPEDLPD